MKSKLLLSIILLGYFINSTAQNTVGIIQNSTESFDGYTLFTQQKKTYLINNCGEVTNEWTSNYDPGNAVYLLENGNLLRAAKTDNTSIVFGGVGGRVELFNWDGSLIWAHNFSSDSIRQHHDIYPMPNGNILVLIVEVLNAQEAISLGRDPNTLPENKLYNEHILEVQPLNTDDINVVWEWHFKDHLIQEFDNTKSNYGIVSQNPQRLDINYLGNSNGNANWLHINSMQYNEELDQIVLSSRLMSEFYIIDHSTTTDQAASSSGGIYNKGGDFLYRWGNPQTYQQGASADQKLFGQHYPHFIPQGFPNAGKIIVFNNGWMRTPSYSQVCIINPSQSAPGVYDLNSNSAYGPETEDYVYIDQDFPSDFFSHFLSGAQQLPNGNILICEGSTGTIFEVTPNSETVWEYISPVGTNGILNQGADPNSIGNTLFRAIRYSSNYPAFQGRDLTPGLPIENNPNLNNCELLSIPSVVQAEIKIYPNPVINKLRIKSKLPFNSIEIFSVLGNKVLSSQNSESINLEALSPGIYILNIDFDGTTITKRILKK